MKSNAVPEALRDVFASITGKKREELVSLEQLSTEQLTEISGGLQSEPKWKANIHSYSFN
ncbi:MULTISPECIES: hypothetical protein [Massilia]|uniref:Uncharacterized protein n=1 Tax=Massilia haematophila TaxID=457923 RepID=A0ABV7PN50_9BURK|nr:hypothetical protein [Massilia sp.]HBZ07511.1 hypothetical protein [Massilia sp.]